MAKEGGGENEVVQSLNAAANTSANAVGNAANNAANAIGNQQQNAAGNARQNARAQPPPVRATCVLRGSQQKRQPIRDEAVIERRANYDRDNRVHDPLDANNPIQATELREMHGIELRRRSQYAQDNGAPDDLCIIPSTHAPGSSSRAINNLSAFS
jgi:hypothetical protein